MKRSILRITGAVFGGALLLFAILGGVAYWRVSSTPSWYQQRLTDPNKIEVAAASAEDKIVETRNWAASVVAEEARAARGATQPTRSVTAAIVPPPADELKIRVTDEELNAFFLKWSKLNGFDDKIARYISDPVVATHDGAIVLAGKLKGSKALDGTIVAMHFKPVLENDQLTMSLTRVTGGEMDIPVSAVETELSQGRDTVKGAVDRWTKDAKLDAKGQANPSLVFTAAGRLLLAMLDRKPVEPVAFLPVDDRRSVPVRLSHLKVENGALEVGARAIPPEDRSSLVDRLKNGR